MLRRAKALLDAIASRESSDILVKAYTLGMPGLPEPAIRRIERALGITLPFEYRDALHKYDWTTLRLGYLSLHATPETLIERNDPRTSEFGDLYAKTALFEIGEYEADVVCIRLDSDVETQGEIVYLDHNDYPYVHPEFVSSSFGKFLLCAVTDLALKKESGYYHWSEEDRRLKEDKLYRRIAMAMSRIDPATIHSTFWFKYIRGI